jgi:nicotinamidase-related amidase
MEGDMNRTVLLDPADAVMLLLDHQNGLFQTVKDVPLAELRTNTVVVAKVARRTKIPLITTASVPDGPNGPLMHELQEVASDATYLPRKGEVSAWDNEDFVRTVKDTGRKTSIIAGVWISVCVAFPALQAKAEGYNVYFVTDASGDPRPMTSQTTIARLAHAGVIPMSACAVFREIQRTWRRPDADQYAELYAAYAPNYRGVEHAGGDHEGGHDDGQPQPRDGEQGDRPGSDEGQAPVPVRGVRDPLQNRWRNG